MRPAKIAYGCTLSFVNNSFSVQKEAVEAVKKTFYNSLHRAIARPAKKSAGLYSCLWEYFFLSVEGGCKKRHSIIRYIMLLHDPRKECLYFYSRLFIYQADSFYMRNTYLLNPAFLNQLLPEDLKLQHNFWLHLRV